MTDRENRDARTADFSCGQFLLHHVFQSDNHTVNIGFGEGAKLFSLFHYLVDSCLTVGNYLSIPLTWLFRLPRIDFFYSLKFHKDSVFATVGSLRCRTTHRCRLTQQHGCSMLTNHSACIHTTK